MIHSRAGYLLQGNYLCTKKVATAWIDVLRYEYGSLGESCYIHRFIETVSARSGIMGGNCNPLVMIA